MVTATASALPQEAGAEWLFTEPLPQLFELKENPLYNWGGCK